MTNKFEKTGKKIQSVGCALTLIITIPIILTATLGIPGLVIGVIVAIVGIAALFISKKNPEEEAPTIEIREPKRQEGFTDLFDKPKTEPYTGPLTINARPPKKFTIRIAQSIPVAGISYRQDALKEMISGSGRQVGLMRQPDNPKDSSAIKVLGRWIDLHGEEKIEHIGYVPKDLSKAIAQKIPNNELRGCLKVIYQPQPDRDGGIRFDIYAAPKP